MTDPDVTYRCNQCGQEFVLQDEAEEHVAWNHDVFEEYIDVLDERNQAEPEGM